MWQKDKPQVTKRNKQNLALIVGSGVLITLTGTAFLLPKASEWLEDSTGIALFPESPPKAEPNSKPSVVLTLATTEPKQREATLEQLASGKPSQERNRARYLLATDLIKEYQGGQAIKQLKGLENTYPVLAPYILLKRGRAYQLTNEKAKAEEIWLTLKEKYPKSPATAEALYVLGQNDPKYWDEAIANFPSHPRTQEIIRKRLEKNPKDLESLLLLARYERSPQTNNIRNRLVNEFSAELTPQDWETIGSGYWQYWQYGKAAEAYNRGPSKPLNIYRAARGAHLEGDTFTAKKRYQRLLSEYKDAKETGLALRHLASLSTKKEALGYLDVLINKFPDEAPKALLKKAEILEKLGNNKSANQTRQILLTKYPNSEATMQYRWQKGEQLAKGGNLGEAITLVKPIITNQAYSDVAPKAGFWLGKWYQRLGDENQAKESFEYVLSHHPQSYWAWRSAVLLGHKVGDFTTVRSLKPEVTQPTTRALPPAGSDAFKELYLLGQDEDARNVFESEIGNRQDLTVGEQFTEGLLRQIQGKYRESINFIWTLKEREDPQEYEQWKALRQTPEYWQALFPFPYYNTILNWSEQRKLNPLLVISLIRQESGFEADAQSPVGAKGLMQVMPATSEWIADMTNLTKYNLANPEDNIKLGTWYFDHTHEQYNDNSVLAVASYNAGPGNVNKWKQRFSFSDPDVFVENIPFEETQKYVESVFGNYWNYLRIYNPEIAELLTKHSASKITEKATP